METLNIYAYPNLGTYKDALVLASATKAHGGTLSNVKAARLLDYSVLDGRSLGGAIYKKFDDLCSFGLFTRSKGTLKLTSLGEEALNEDDFQKSDSAKIKAIKSISIIAKAFDAWNGVLPDADSLQEELSTLTNTPYTECKEHVTHLQKLFQETFPALNGTQPATSNEKIEISKLLNQEQVEGHEFARSRQALIGELRTRIGTVVITDGSTLELAIKHLEVLKEQLRDIYVTEAGSADNTDSA